MKLKLAGFLVTVVAPLLLVAQQNIGQLQATHFSREAIKSTFSGAPPNAPGMVLTGVIAEYRPGDSTPAHRHGDAFVLAYVLSGAIVSKVDDGKERIFRAGESFTEGPNAHHVVFRNPSKSESAKILAVFLAPKGDKELVILDH